MRCMTPDETARLNAENAASRAMESSNFEIQTSCDRRDGLQEGRRGVRRECLRLRLNASVPNWHVHAQTSGGVGRCCCCCAAMLRFMRRFLNALPGAADSASAGVSAAAVSHGTHARRHELALRAIHHIPSSTSKKSSPFESDHFITTHKTHTHPTTTTSGRWRPPAHQSTQAGAGAAQGTPQHLNTSRSTPEKRV
jgi:hypothetical protein